MTRQALLVSQCSWRHKSLPYFLRSFLFLIGHESKKQFLIWSEQMSFLMDEIINRLFFYKTHYQIVSLLTILMTKTQIENDKRFRCFSSRNLWSKRTVLYAREIKKKLLLCIFRIHLNVEETKSLAYKLISTRLQRVTIPNKIGCLVKFEKSVCTIQT